MGDRDVNVRAVRVRPGVGARLEEVLALVDQTISDDVVRRWMAQNRVHELCTAFALECHVDGMNDAVTVWVVVTDSGAMRFVPDPPIAVTRAVGPTLIDFVSEPS
jgi:hypothetical protein